MSDAALWVTAADADIDGVRRCLAGEPNLAVAAFLCQQAAETPVKALLVHLGIRYPRGRSGHDIGACAERLPAGHPLAEEAAAFDAITDWVAEFRYSSSDPLEAQPLPTAAEIAAWLARIEAFRTTVARETGAA